MKTRGYGTDCVICRSVIWDGSSDNRSFATNCFPSFFFRTTTHIFLIYTRWVSPTCCCCCVSIPDDDSLCWWKKIRAIIRIEFLFMLRSDKQQQKITGREIEPWELIYVSLVSAVWASFTIFLKNEVVEVTICVVFWFPFSFRRNPAISSSTFSSRYQFLMDLFLFVVFLVGLPSRNFIWLKSSWWGNRVSQKTEEYRTISRGFREKKPQLCGITRIWPSMKLSIILSCPWRLY